VIPAAGGHGGDGARVAAALGLDPAEVLDLSASLNPVAPDPAPVIARHLDALGRYPDPAGATAALAETMGVDVRCLVLTNGGSEAIALVAAEVGRGWVEEPDFALYRRHLAVIEPGAPAWRSDPHNPTGRLAPPGAEAAVWDEAFYPLATGRWTSGRAATGALVLGSLTKVLACPGLRIGYVVVPDDDGQSLGVPGLRERLARRQPAWSVGPLALAAIPDLLASADLGRWALAVARGRAELVAVLGAHGLTPMPSDANFVLVPGVPGLRAALAAEGVVVRDCASFGLPDHVRIAVPGGDDLTRLDQALTRCTAVVGDTWMVNQ